MLVVELFDAWCFNFSRNFRPRYGMRSFHWEGREEYADPEYYHDISATGEFQIRIYLSSIGFVDGIKKISGGLCPSAYVFGFKRITSSTERDMLFFSLQ